MSARNLKLLAATSAIFALSQSASAVTLSSIASGYDVFVKESAELNGVHVHGALAADSAVLSSTSVNSQGGAHDATYSLAANSVSLSNNNSVGVSDGQGQARITNLLTGQSFNAPNSNQIWLQQSGGSLDLSNAGNSASSVNQSAGIDFGSAFDSLNALSDSIADLAPTLFYSDFTSDLNNVNFTLGNSGVQQVLNLTASQFASFVNIGFNAVSGFTDTLIINVDFTGFTGTISQNRNGSDAAANNVLWNFYGDGVSEVSLQNQFLGSILAADLDLVHTNNDIKGSIYAKSFEKNGGQIHVHPFSGDFNLPVPDASSTLVMILIALPAMLFFRRRMR